MEPVLPKILEKDGPDGPSGGSPILPASPEAQFFNQHIKDNPKLSPDSRAFMARLLLNLEDLPWSWLEWARGHPVECVFEDSRGEVQVCINRRHLHFSPARENFIADYIRDRRFTPDEQLIMSEWVRSSASGQWNTRGVELEISEPNYGVFALKISWLTITREDGDIIRTPHERELVLSSQKLVAASFSPCNFK